MNVYIYVYMRTVVVATTSHAFVTKLRVIFFVEITGNIQSISYFPVYGDTFLIHVYTGIYIKLTEKLTM